MSGDLFDDGNVEQVSIDESVRNSYLDYSMSVIIGRALPNAKDGLKPVHRRILYAMNEINLTHRNPYKKSARIVGDVIGKYHPHGDTSVYDALVRMAQDFSMRLELVDGQGNFGSMDGDSPAAMRYTEARMTLAGEDMLRDIEKDTVDFMPNYDGTLKEPDVLPARFPNLLVNGSNGIAVGMATSIPPHRVDEIVDCLLYLVDNKNACLDDILQFIQGPDFPTGGIIYGRGGILEAYRTGRGKIRVRAKAHVESSKHRDSIIVDELPFQVNKSRLVKQIDDLVKEKVIDGISEIRDESDREGVRVVIELKKDAMSEIVLNRLFKSSLMEVTFGIILLAINNKEPKIFTLVELLNVFLSHRKTVIIRRTIYDLEKAKARLHIVEGLRIAVQDDRIDEVVSIIRESSDTDSARAALMSTFSLSELQSKAILDMRLQRLTGLERDKLENEYNELVGAIKDLSLILKSEDRLNEIIKIELAETKVQFSTPRRTLIEDNYDAIDVQDLIANERVVVTISHRGYVKRVLLKVYDKQHRGGKGKIGASTHEDDFIQGFFIANTHDTIMFITNKGRLYWLKVYRIPEAGRTAIGKAVVNLINLDDGEKIMTTITTTDFGSDKSLVFFTRNGLVKRTNLSEYGNVRNNGVRAINLDDDDELIGASISDTSAKEFFIATKLGQCIRFPVSSVKEIGRVGRGVIGIKFKNDHDSVVSATIIRGDNDKLLSVSELGIGKQTNAGSYSVQSRAGKGNIAMRLTGKTGNLVSMLSINEPGMDLMLLTTSGKMIRVDIDSIRQAGRNTSGVRIVNVGDKDRVVFAGVCSKEDTDVDVSSEE